MRIVMTGSGYVGLVSGACLADFGHDVVAPESNCGEVVGRIPNGLEVFRVAQLEDAITAVEAIAAGDTSDLPRCGD